MVRLELFKTFLPFTVSSPALTRLPSQPFLFISHLSRLLPHHHHHSPRVKPINRVGKSPVSRSFMPLRRPVQSWVRSWRPRPCQDTQTVQAHERSFGAFCSPRHNTGGRGTLPSQPWPWLCHVPRPLCLCFHHQLDRLSSQSSDCCNPNIATTY
jgi:hypothetical protein